MVLYGRFFDASYQKQTKDMTEEKYLMLLDGALSV